MNGIKGTAKERDAARMMFGGGAVRLRYGQCASQESLSVVSSQFFSKTKQIFHLRLFLETIYKQIVQKIRIAMSRSQAAQKNSPLIFS